MILWKFYQVFIIISKNEGITFKRLAPGSNLLRDPGVLRSIHLRMPCRFQAYSTWKELVDKLLIVLETFVKKLEGDHTG